MSSLHLPVQTLPLPAGQLSAIAALSVHKLIDHHLERDRFSAP